MVLPPDTKIGASFSELFPHRADVRFEIDNKSITHRPDLWSHEGFAREIGALFNRPFTSVDQIRTAQNPEGRRANSRSRIDNPDAAPRYSGLVVAGH